MPHRQTHQNALPEFASNHRLHRRRCLAAAGGVATAAIAGLKPSIAEDDDRVDPTPVETTAGETAPRIEVSLAAYSFRKYFGVMRGQPQTPPDGESPMSIIDFFDYCVGHGFDAAEPTAYFFESEDDAYLLNLKRQAFRRALPISGTAISNDFTTNALVVAKQILLVQAWINRAAVLGAPHIRIFAGTGKQLADHPERFDAIIDAVKQSATVAANKGVVLGIENHGKMSADQMVRIMDAAESNWVGMNLDTGNFVSDDPYADVQRCLKYAVNIQLKPDMRRPDGTRYPADIERLAKIIVDGGYRGYVAIEDEGEDPKASVPRLADRFRKAIGM